VTPPQQNLQNLQTSFCGGSRYCRRNGRWNCAGDNRCWTWKA